MILTSKIKPLKVLFMDEKTIELLMNLIKKNEIKLVKEEALISLSKIISDKDFIIKLIKDDISLCKFYESRINLF